MDTARFEVLNVTMEEGGALCVVSLDHGKANECGRAALAELGGLEVMIRGDPQVRGLIVCSTKVTSSGTPVFISGANVTERVGWSDDEVKAHVRWQRGILASLRALPVFTIIVVDGLALGLGTELLLTADWRIATPRARFGLPETGLGIIPGALGTAELASLVGPAVALYLGCTGAQLDASGARDAGLVDALVSDQEEGLTVARGMMAQVRTRSPRAVAAFKAAVKGGMGHSFEARVAREEAAYEGLVDGGEAAIGRAHFKDIREGKTPPWSPREA